MLVELYFTYTVTLRCWIRYRSTLPVPYRTLNVVNQLPKSETPLRKRVIGVLISVIWYINNLTNTVRYGTVFYVTMTSHINEVLRANATLSQ